MFRPSVLELLAFTANFKGDTWGATMRPVLRMTWFTGWFRTGDTDCLRGGEFALWILYGKGDRRMVTSLLSVLSRLIKLGFLSVNLAGLVLLSLLFFNADFVGLARILSLDNRRGAMRSCLFSNECDEDVGVVASRSTGTDTLSELTVMLIFSIGLNGDAVGLFILPSRQASTIFPFINPNRSTRYNRYFVLSSNWKAGWNIRHASKQSRGRYSII